MRASGSGAGVRVTCSWSEPALPHRQARREGERRREKERWGFPTVLPRCRAGWGEEVGGAQKLPSHVKNGARLVFLN